MATTTRRKPGKTTLRVARGSKGKVAKPQPVTLSPRITGQGKFFGRVQEAAKRLLQAVRDLKEKVKSWL